MTPASENGDSVKRAAQISSNPKSVDSTGSTDNCVQDWTIMLYIAADGTIANFGIESLKQVNRSIAIPPGPQDQTVVVAAQFAIDAPGGQPVARYIFNKYSGGSVGNSFVEYLDGPDNMTEQESLISFIKWVYHRPDCKANNYALILWGHGPEFLMQPPGATANNPRTDLYLSPEELREALRESISERQKLRIIGFDACSMSMFEMAYEIRHYADYMVASQQEVPDLSFPYDSLVPLFRRSGGGGVEQLLIDGVYAYVDAYQDYVSNATTGMKLATLSALNLSHCDRLRCALQCLACALLDAIDEPGLPPLLVQARAWSRDYAGGLYVDLVDFAIKLSGRLSIGKWDYVLNSHGSAGPEAMMRQERQRMRYSKIVAACKKTIAALVEDSTGKELVLANSSEDSDSHGVSLYFPYLSDAVSVTANPAMVKGGIGTVGMKEFSTVLNGAGSGLLMCARRQMILDTEGYYEDLQLAIDTGWYRFIVEMWSQILAQTAPAQLDFLYSAQQCAMNLSRSSVPVRAVPCPAPVTQPKVSLKTA